jgi:hypothetical protein
MKGYGIYLGRFIYWKLFGIFLEEKKPRKKGGGGRRLLVQKNLRHRDHLGESYPIARRQSPGGNEESIFT